MIKAKRAPNSWKIMEELLIEAKDLRKSFPITSGLFRKVVGAVHALSGVDLQLAKGEVLGIVGETGCGKSTLGRVLLRLIEPTSGELKFEGTNLLALEGKQLIEFRKKAQIIFQDPYASLNPRKTIRDNIGEGLLYHKLVTTKEEQSERVAEILSQIGLPAEAMMRYPHQFSGGQQQRICIGRAIALNPSLIICDEALSALDVSVQAQMLNLLQELKQKYGLSYIFISHDLSCVHYLCDQVIVLYLGKVMEKASVQELFQNPRHPYTQALLSAIPKNHPEEEKKRIHLNGEIPSASHPPSGCPFRTRCPYAQSICSLPPPQRVVQDKYTGKYDHEYACILGSD